MTKLPLFPLNTVLFPGMPISLHIFEERYKQMIGKCLETRQPFGIVLIQNGVEALGPLAETYSVGCTAQIVQMQPLSEGRMNIVAVGQERFQILSISHDLPYLVGTVELLPLKSSNAVAVAQNGRHLRSWIERYLQALSHAERLQFDVRRLPGEPLTLAYLAAFLLQIPPVQKQSLLAALHADEFMRDVLALYRREVTLLNAMRAKNVVEEGGQQPFSLN